jgi:hypothetical protein
MPGRFKESLHRIFKKICIIGGHTDRLKPLQQPLHLLMTIFRQHTAVKVLSVYMNRMW